MDELPLDTSKNLPLNIDPKTAWAKTHLAEQPIEINLADRHELLRIPGIGPKGALAILNTRKNGRLRSLSELGKIGVDVTRVSPFILVNDKRPSYQLMFW
jgi:predicted DNA-binding helix-hairpin-helix protein